MKFDFIAIGDITTDCFIRLKDAEAHCDINKEHCTLSVRFGDKVPYESATEVRGVGNSPNAAVSAHRLGLKTALVSDIGSDENGDKILTTLLEEGLDTRYLKRHDGLATNYHYVLWYEDERTILVLHHEYPYALPSFEEPPKWIYLSSIGEKSLPYHAAIATYVAAHPETKLAFQPGTFQMKDGFDSLKEVYAHTAAFCVNREEAENITNTPKGDIQEMSAKLHALGPKMVIITDNRNGAYLSDGSDIWKMPLYPDTRAPFERTGAGDAFFSTFIAALAAGLSTQEALRWAPINAMSVVQEIGAQKGLLTRAKIEQYLREAPANYKPERM